MLSDSGGYRKVTSQYLLNSRVQQTTNNFTLTCLDSGICFVELYMMAGEEIRMGDKNSSFFQGSILDISSFKILNLVS